MTSFKTYDTRRLDHERSAHTGHYDLSDAAAVRGTPLFPGNLRRAAAYGLSVLSFRHGHGSPPSNGGGAMHRPKNESVVKLIRVPLPDLVYDRCFFLSSAHYRACRPRHPTIAAPSIRPLSGPRTGRQVGSVHHIVPPSRHSSVSSGNRPRRSSAGNPGPSAAKGRRRHQTAGRKPGPQGHPHPQKAGRHRDSFGKRRLQPPLFHNGFGIPA